MIRERVHDLTTSCATCTHPLTDHPDSGPCQKCECWEFVQPATATLHGPPELTAHVPKRDGRRTGAAATVRKLKLKHPELTDGEIARTVGCSKANVTNVLKRFLGNKNTDDNLRAFQDNKAEIFDALQYRTLSSINNVTISKASLLQRVTSAAILEDKARVIRGQATGINVTVLMDAVAAIRARDAKR